MWTWKGKKPPLEDEDWQDLFSEELVELSVLLGEEQPVFPVVFKGKWKNLELGYEFEVKKK